MSKRIYSYLLNKINRFYFIYKDELVFLAITITVFLFFSYADIDYIFCELD